MHEANVTGPLNTLPQAAATAGVPGMVPTKEPPVPAASFSLERMLKMHEANVTGPLNTLPQAAATAGVPAVVPTERPPVPAASFSLERMLRKVAGSVGKGRKKMHEANVT